MIKKILDIITWIILTVLVAELALSKESIAIKVIALMLILIFLVLDRISRKLWCFRRMLNQFDLNKSQNC